jgi:hypothetical protein
MSQINRLTKRLLQELHHNEGLVSTVPQLVDILESKIDPTLEEIKMIDSLYQFLEKFKMLEEVLKENVRILMDNELKGDLLNRLYNDNDLYNVEDI